jgi:hypothetical protein
VDDLHLEDPTPSLLWAAAGKALEAEALSAGLLGSADGPNLMGVGGKTLVRLGPHSQRTTAIAPYNKNSPKAI